MTVQHQCTQNRTEERRKFNGTEIAANGTTARSGNVRACADRLLLRRGRVRQRRPAMFRQKISTYFLTQARSLGSRRTFGWSA